MRFSALHAMCVVIVAGTVILSALPARADTIVLKDGTRETSKRVWESEQYVHFILKGTQSVEIRFDKEIVEHIERDGLPVTKGGAAPEPPGAKNEAGPNLPEPASAQKINHSANLSDSLNPEDALFIKGNRGIQFYDPRRKQRYWASRDARYNILADAIGAMAERYKRSVQWVEKNMGEENDLAEIHRNLIGAILREKASEKNGDMGHRQGGAPDKNAAVETLPKKNEETRLNDSWPINDTQLNPKGIQFYDPRREAKYWSTAKTHHQSFEAAVEALATLYGVTPKWIEDHMGDSNDLEKIHQNIRSALTSH